MVQLGGASAVCGPARSPPRCTKSNCPPINGQRTNIAVSWSVALGFNVPNGLITILTDKACLWLKAILFWTSSRFNADRYASRSLSVHASIDRTHASTRTYVQCKKLNVHYHAEHAQWTIRPTFAVLFDRKVFYIITRSNTPAGRTQKHYCCSHDARRPL